jgi:hypothetical protein
MQAIEATATVYHTIPVSATEESQADKGIDHPLVFCDECDTVWRSHGRSRCPTCARQEGTHFSLNADQNSNLYQAMCGLEETGLSYTEEQLEHSMWRFHNLLREEAPWYNETSRQMIQACYECFLRLDRENLRVALAIHFFKEEFKYAPEEDNTFCPEVIEYQERDAQYDLQNPSW